MSPLASRPDHDEPQGLTTLFYRNSYLMAATILVLLVGGISAVITLPRAEDPRIHNRNVFVFTPVPGASAERVDTLVTEVLEVALQEIPEIKEIQSNSRAGISILAIEMADWIDASSSPAVSSEIRDKLAEAERLLPPDALAPFYDDQRPPAGFSLVVAISWQGEDEPVLGILDRVAEDLADRLRGVAGTEIVRVYGAPEEEITVTVDSTRMADLGLGAGDVARRIAAADAKGSAGVLRARGTDIQLEVTGELDSLARIRAVPLSADEQGSVVRLADVAEVERRPKEPASAIALVDGQRAVLVGARILPSERIDHWTAEARAALDAFAAGVGEGVGVDPIFEQNQYTSKQLNAVSGNLVAGAVVIVVVIFFMMGWRLALVVGLALPLVVSSLLLGWQVGGNAIQQMSVFGMIIALGLLIDNAIVVADEIAKEISAGYSRGKAVDRAVRHLAVPLFGSTLTTVLAFAPILLLTGSVGDFIGSIGTSVILSVTASFAIALTVVAGLAGRFAKPAPREAAGGRSLWQHGLDSGPLLPYYRQGLRESIHRPAVGLLIALFLPMAGFLTLRDLGNEFFPPVDRDLFEVRMWMPVDASIGNTLERAREAEAMIREMPGAERVFWMVGGSFPSVFYNLVMNKEDSPSYAQAIVQAHSNAEAKAMIDRLQAAFDQRFPEAQLVVRQFGQGPPIFADVEFQLYGPDLDVLQDLGEEVRLAMQRHPEILVSRSSLPRGEPKLWLEADEDEARLAGFALTEVASQLRTNLDGGVGGSVVEDLERLPVRVRYGDERDHLESIASMPMVRPGQPDWVPLSALGELELRPEIGVITRKNGERVHRLQAFARNGALRIDVGRAVLRDLEASGFTLPPGYRMEIGGVTAEDREAKAELGKYVPVLVVITIAALVLSFGSVRLAGLLFVIAGLSVGLGFLSTWMIDFPISFNSILGILGLIGVALNDSIVVLAAIRAHPRARRGDVEAIVEEVIGCTRHVLSTTLTTIGGFLPLLLFVGGDFWPSLAIVLVGGIAGASILAVVFVPASYVLIVGKQPPREVSGFLPIQPASAASGESDSALSGGVA